MTSHEIEARERDRQNSVARRGASAGRTRGGKGKRKLAFRSCSDWLVGSFINPACKN